MGSTTENKNYPVIDKADNMRETSVPELQAFAAMVDADMAGVDAAISGLENSSQAIAAQAVQAQQSAQQAAEEASNLQSAVDDVATALDSRGPFGKLKMDLLQDDITVNEPSWFKPDGVTGHTLTLGSGFADSDVVVISDPKQTLPDTPITLVSKTPGVELIENSDFSGGTTQIDHDPDGLHNVPSSWDVRNPASVNPAAWFAETDLCRFEATASGGGIVEDAVYTLNVTHRVQVKARKLSGDDTARLILYVEGNAVDVAEMEIVPASVNTWQAFSGEAEPTVSTDVIIECRDGAAVWEIEYVKCSQYARFRLDAETAGEGLLLDAGGITLAYDLEDNEWQKV